MTETAHAPNKTDGNGTPTLPRSVGFWGATLLPINGMIGAGIFALPAIMVAAVGSFAPWMMLLGALLIMPLAITFALLATRFDRHGGPVLYTHTAFGPFVGFQTGWSRYASGVVSVAANTQVAVAYLAVLFPALADPTVKMIAVTGFIVFTTIVNLVGMRASVNVLALMTVLKLLPLAGFVIYGLATLETTASLELPTFSEFESVILLTFYAFMAFENGTFAAGELKHPKRDVPLSLMATITVVAVFYMVIIAVYQAAAPDIDANANALAAASAKLFGQIGAVLISLAAACSIAANSMTGGIVTPRMTYGMAEQGTLPEIFAHVSPRFRTPDISILFYGGCAILFSLWAGFAVLAAASTLSRLVMYLLAALALPVLEHREPEPAPIWHTVMALLAAASAIWVASQANAEAYGILGLILVVGSLLFWLARGTQGPRK